ncbi:MAG: Ig-like domain-containing protein [Chlamydiota bacterium]
MKSLFLFALFIPLALTGCGGGSSESSTPPPQSVTLSSLQITTSSSTVPLGGVESLAAIGTYSDGHTHDLTDKVTWTSSAEEIATVSSLGDVTGASFGSVTVTAVSGSVQDSLALTVGPPALSRIDISPSAPSTPANTTLQLVAMGRYTDGSIREVNDLVSWTSSDASKVTISASGLARAFTIGAATVTAKTGDIAGSATMMVSTAQLVRMAVLPYQPVTGIGVKQHFTALGTFDDYGTRELASVSWSSSSPAVAGITAGGVATPLQAGSTTITGAVGTISNSTVLTVLQASLGAIVVTPGKASIAPGSDQQFATKGLLSDGSLVELPVLTWASSDNAVATIDSSGRALASTPGTSIISASVAGVSGSSTLQVTSAQLQSIVVAPGAPVLPILSMKQLYAVGTFSDGSVQDLTNAVTWWSNSSRVATVSHSGLVSSNATGSATISATLGTTRGAAVLQVSPVTVDSVTVQPAEETVAKGTKVQYSLYSNLSDGTTVLLDAPRWFTSPVTIATAASDGLVTARTAGIGKVYGETCCKTSYTLLTVTSARAVSLTITPASPSVPVGGMQQLTAIASFDDGSTQDVSNGVHWTSTQSSAARVDGTGVATGMTAGATTVSATFGPVEGSAQTVSATTSLSVTGAQLTGLSITPGNATMTLGQARLFAALGSFSDHSVHPVAGLSWHSSNPAVAIVLPSGLVISSGKGSAVITAASGGIQASASMTVQ